MLRKFGDLDGLRIEEIEEPRCEANEIIVRVSVASINPVDWKVVNGSLQDLFPIQLPRVLGRDCVGTVALSKSDLFKVGDRVIGVTDARRNGTHTDFAVMSDRQVCVVADHVSNANAVAVGNSGVTALTCLKETSKLKLGQKILIHAGAGAVGSLAVQLAHHMGATVVATCSERDIPYVRSCGANHVVDYQKDDFEELVNDCDVVLDLVGGSVHQRSARVLKPGGTLTYVHALPVEAISRSDIRVLRAEISATASQLDYLIGLLALGKLRPKVAAEYQFPDAKLAYQHAASKRNSGKVLLRMD